MLLNDIYRLSPRAIAVLMDEMSDPTMPINKAGLYPMSMDTCRPLMWTPIEIGYDGVPVDRIVSQVVWMYDDALDEARPLTDAEKRDTVIVGCSGRSPGPIHISWEEATDAEAPPRTFRETMFADVLTLDDLLAIFAKTYENDHSLPPAGMTLRRLMTDPLGCRVHIEFKSYREVLLEEAEFESLFASQQK